jgi:ketosteroid isomerase-like protein
MEKTPSPASPSPALELVQKLYTAFEHRDVATVAGLLGSHAIICQSAELPWGGTFEGLEGFSRFFGLILQHIDSKVTVDRYIDAAECIVAIGSTRGTVNANGASFEVPVVHVWQVEEGKITKFSPYIDVPTMIAALHKEPIPTS